MDGAELKSIVVQVDAAGRKNKENSDENSQLGDDAVDAIADTKQSTSSMLSQFAAAATMPPSQAASQFQVCSLVHGKEGLSCILSICGSMICSFALS